MSFSRPFLVRSVVPILSLVLLNGCSSVSFSKNNKTSIGSVNVARQSQYPSRDEIVIFTAGQNWGAAVGGVVGAAIAHAAAGDDRSRFEAALKTHQVDPGLIMAEVFEEELTRTQLLPVQKTADATFSFRVKVVGLMIRHGFSAALSPYLAIEGKLTRKDGTVLWKHVDWIRDGDSRHSTDEYVNNPDLLRSAFRTAASRLAKNVVRELHDESHTAYESHEDAHSMSSRTDSGTLYLKEG